MADEPHHVFKQLTSAELSKVMASINANGLPDLTIDSARLKSSAVIKTQSFKPGDCAIVEGCVASSGKRKLLRFDVSTPNIGTADMVLGDPALSPKDSAGNLIFIYSPCHRHYHFDGYANYQLLKIDKTTVVVEGRKQAFCLLDYEKVDLNAGPAKFSCGYQGISVGWQDTYGSYLDCQWLDITNVAAGNYFLRVEINPKRRLKEGDYSNNTATVSVSIR